MFDKIIDITDRIRLTKYPKAKVIFLAGSIVRGEGTPFSDLDLVVVFENLPTAFRESFYFDGFPIEAFVHDPETLNYVLTEGDFKKGECKMAQMISEGLEIPESSPLSLSLKQLAASVISSGPPKLDEEGLRRMRYNITSLIDDIRHPRSKAELVATGATLYDVLANCFLRTHNCWAASGKSIPRRLELANPEVNSHFCDSFEQLFTSGQPEAVITLSGEILGPIGGFLFDGHKLDAPSNNRKPFAN